MQEFFLSDAAESVAFSATMSATEQHLLINEVVQFDVLHTNLGNHFDPVSHKFICPLTGIYEFKLNVHSKRYMSAKLNIDVAGAMVGELLVADAHFDGASSTSVVYSCNADSVVKVLAYQEDNNILGFEKSVFTGKLLETDEG